MSPYDENDDDTLGMIARRLAQTAQVAEQQQPVPEIAPQHVMGIDRVEKRRRLNTRGIKLTDKEAALVAALHPDLRKKTADKLRATKALYPPSKGWGPAPEAHKIDFDSKGNPKPTYREQPYSFHRADQDKVLRQALGEIRGWVAKAQGSGPEAETAKTILRQAGWYRETMRKGFDERGGAYPAFTDLLGATSPNTPVPENYKMAVELQDQQSRGTYDDANQKLKEHLDAGNGLKSFPDEDLVAKQNGKKFGFNTRNAMNAMVDQFGKILPGQKPKARNFAGNLGGRTDKATIDVWAARFLQRMAGKAHPGEHPRIATEAEAGVDGALKKDLTAGGAFGYGQQLFQRLADRLNKTGELRPYLAELGYKHVTPMDLQALTWFIEKHMWGQNKWTNKTGEGGSFEDEMAKYPTTRYQSGFSIQQDHPPSDEDMGGVRANLEDVLRQDKQLRAYRINPTYGQYGKDFERSFDSEISAHPGWDPSKWMAATLEHAKAHNQKDVMFSRRLGHDEADQHPNARPGVEIYFDKRKSIDEVQPILDKFRAKGMGDFTYITDLKHRERTSGGKDSPDYVGVRLQWVPEITQRFDPDKARQWEEDPDSLRQAKDDALDKMQEVARHIANHHPGVVDSRVHFYDTVVSGQEDYDDHIRELRGEPGLSETSPSQIRGQVRQGRSLHTHVARRNQSLGARPEARDDDPRPALDRGPELKLKTGGSVPVYEPGAPIHHPAPEDPVIIGAIESDIPGRTDKHEVSVPAGSFVIPADVVSALGQGNTLAGQRALDKMFRQGDQGAPDIHAHMARGGPATTVPVVLAGGEYVVAPAAVARRGMGNLERGHRALEKFVLATRKKTVQTLKSLPGPKR
jgi:hypothetical protein